MENQTPSQAEHIIGKFGSLGALSRALGHRHASTVQGWRERGFIPAPQQLAVLEAARANGIDLTPADFFPAESKAAE